MRTAKVALVAVMMVLFGGKTLWAQETRELRGSFSISPFGSVVIPVGDFSDTDPSNKKFASATTGSNVGVALEYGLTENVAVGARFSYSQFGLNEAIGHVFDSDAGDGNWTIIEIFGAYIKLLTSAGRSTRPFARIGAFAGKPTVSAVVSFDSFGETAEAEKRISNSLGIDAGVGVMHMFSDHVAGFIETSLAHLLTDEREFDLLWNGSTVETGENQGNLQWVTFRGGLSINFGGTGSKR